MARRKRKSRGEWKFEDFRAILDLPERLAQYLRELLHLDKAVWDFALDKIRQHKAGTAPAYREWSKSKGRGKGRRYFAAPCQELKTVQKALLQRLLMTVPVHCCRHGNQPGSSILTNVSRHVGFAKTVFSVDIINAFPTVFRSRVKANLKLPLKFVLRQFAGVEFSGDDREKMLESLVDLLCLRDRLPQGPPTSPRILDIVCAKMDSDVYGLLAKNRTPLNEYRYTAWADDLTISSDGEIPEELRGQVLGMIRTNGFIPHTRADKTKYFSPETGEVPVVTGLVLNADGRITMHPRKVNQFRARLHQLLKRKTWDEETKGKVAGTMGYIRLIYPKNVPSTLREVVAAVEEKMAAEQVQLGRAPKKVRKAVKALRTAAESKARSTKTKPKKNGHAKDEAQVLEMILPMVQSI